MSTRIAGRQQSAESASMMPGEQDSSVLFGLAASAALLIGHVPLVLTYFRRLVLFEHYEFVPLLAIGLCLLFWSRVKQISRDELLASCQAGVPVSRLLIGCATLSVASLFCSPWAAMVSLVISLGLMLHSLTGSHWKAFRPVWALTFLMVRPPLHLDLTLISWLQLETSRVASLVLERLGVMHLMEGNVLVVPQRRFLVEEACSGIHSVFALLTAAAFYAVWMQTPRLRGVLLMASSVFWACFMNLVRISATIIAFENFEIDLSTGWAHSVTGLITFLVAVIFLAFTDLMLQFFLSPIDPHKVTYWKQDKNPFVRMWNGTKSRQRSNSLPEPPSHDVPAQTSRVTLATPILVGSFSALAVLWQVSALRSEKLGVEAPAAIASLTSESLPFQLGNWVQTDFDIRHRDDDPILSDVSKVWTYRGPSHGALVSIDYPFQGWHQLSICYQAQGWNVDSYQAVPLVGSQGRHISEVHMHRETGEQGLLLFVVMDDRGRPLRDPAIESFWMQIVGRAIERVQRPLAAHLPAMSPNSTVTTQLQMLLTSTGGTIPSAVSQEARSHFSDLQTNVAGLLTTEMTVAMNGDTR